MNDRLARMVGDRVRFYRTAAHLTKTVVAGLTGITPDYLYQIERGQKLPTIPVLTQLAEVLRVKPGDLLSAESATPPRRAPNVTGDAIYRAMTAPAAASPAPVNELRRQVCEAWSTWQTSGHRYSELTVDLPELIATARATVGGTSGKHQRQAQAIAADLYGLLRTVTKRVGRVDLSLLAADRAQRAAEQADDPLRLAGARWNLIQVMLADGHAEAAEDEAMKALGDLRAALDPGHHDAAALSGALLLIAAVAAVRAGDAWTGRERLRQAAPLAERVGDRNVCWTAFGPTNVAMYAVSIEVESGEAVEGLRLAANIDHERSPSIERRVAFLLDQAKGYAQRRQFAQTLALLTTAEADAPEDVRYRPAAHSLIRTVMDRGRRAEAAAAAKLASRVGLPI